MPSSWGCELVSGYLRAPRAGLEWRTVSNEKTASTEKLAQLEAFQRESPCRYSRGKKLPSRSGIWGRLAHMSNRVSQGKSARR